MIPIYKPYLPKQSLTYAKDAIDSTWISSQGKYLSKAQELLKEKNKSKFVILSSNGTTATHLVSIGLRYKYPNLEALIIPNGVYVAAWNSFMMSEKYRFCLASMDKDTWNCDYLGAIRSEFDLKDMVHHLDGARDIGVVIVHNIGNIVNVPKLQEETKNLGTVFVEDNCEGFLGSYESNPSGSKSLLSSVSFFGNKTITSGEGGAVFTDDEEVFNHLNSVRNQGHASKNYTFNKLGYNYRMTNIQAAILLGQLESLEEILEKKEQIFNLYKQELSSVEEICFQQQENDTKHSNWMFAIRCKETIAEKLQLHLYQNKIDSRSMFPPINQHLHLNNFNNDEVASVLWKSVVMLPSFPELTNHQITYICNQIKSFFSKNMC